MYLQRSGYKFIVQVGFDEKMKCNIRKIRETEYCLLEDFLYEAIYVPQGMQPPNREIIKLPELQVYISDFGIKNDDYGLVAELNGEVIGAIWARIMDDYGHIGDETPSLALAIYDGYRGVGIGTALLNGMIDLLRDKGYRQVSLSVQKSNPAVRLYQKIGFEQVGSTMGETEEELIMRYKL